MNQSNQSIIDSVIEANRVENQLFLLWEKGNIKLKLIEQRTGSFYFGKRKYKIKANRVENWLFTLRIHAIKDS